VSRSRSGVNVPLLAAAVAAALLIVVLGAGWLPRTTWGTATPSTPTPVTLPPSASNTSAPPTVTIAPAGMEIDLVAHGFQSVMFAIALPAVISGSYESNVSVAAFVLAPAAYTEFVTDGIVDAPVWTSDGGPGGAVDLDAAAGTWYLVFSAEALASPATIHITSPILAEASPP